MYAHVYHEGEGSKGGDNVASLILKTLKHLGWLEDNGVAGYELNLIFDNCPSQNKNNTVLWLVPYLTEAGFFLLAIVFSWWQDIQKIVVTGGSIF